MQKLFMRVLITSWLSNSSSLKYPPFYIVEQLLIALEKIVSVIEFSVTHPHIALKPIS